MILSPLPLPRPLTPAPSLLLACPLVLIAGALMAGTIAAQEASTDRAPRIAESSSPGRLVRPDDFSSMRLLAQAAPAPAPKPADAAPDAPKPAAPAAPADTTTTPPAVPPAFPGGFGNRGGRGGRPGGPGADPAEGLKVDGDKVTLQFPNNTINDILGIYELLTGKTLIKDTNIFEGQSISLVTPQPVEKAEAVKLIEASMLTNGYAIIADPSGKSARILPTRSRDSRDMQFSAGVKFYQSVADLPENETLVSYFMKLDHLDPNMGAQILGNHVGLSVYGRITPVATPPGLLITESATIVKQLASIKDVIDSADSTNALVTKFVPVKYADAPTVAQIIQSSLDAQAQDKEQKGLATIRGSGPVYSKGTGAPGTPPPAPVPSASTSAAGQQLKKQAKSQVIADPRLNQILIVAEPADYAYVVSLIAEFDKPVEVPMPYERKLKNIFSLDVLSVLADLLKDTAKGTTQLPGGGTLSASSQQPLVSSSSTTLTGRSSTASSQRGGQISRTGTTGGADTTTGGAGTGRPDQLVESTQDNAPVSVLINKTRVIADPLANSIIVIGPKEDKDKVDLLLDRLDNKPPQAYLSTVIGELTLDNSVNSGIDFLQKFKGLGTNQGYASSNLNSRTDIITKQNITDMRTNELTTPFGPLKGFNIYGQLSGALDTFVNMLETTSKFKVLSRPCVFALNNKKAVISSGQSIPYASSTTTNTNSATAASNGLVTATTDYKDVVLKLEVIPLIDPDGEITLKIAQVNDSLLGYATIGQNNAPIIGTEQLTTTVTVPSGNTVVLGGLIVDQYKKDTQGVPFISRIPLLGRLFKNDTRDKLRKELIIFIQPQVVNDDKMLRRMSLKEDLRSRVGGDAARIFPEVVIPVALPVEEPEPLLPGERQPGGKMKAIPASAAPPVQR